MLKLHRVLLCQVFKETCRLAVLLLQGCASVMTSCLCDNEEACLLASRKTPPVQAGALPACVESLGDYFAAAGIVGE
jgi:hypothetical protein